METRRESKATKISLVIYDTLTKHIGGSLDAFCFIKPIYRDLDTDQAHLAVLFLTDRNALRGYAVMGTGTRTKSQWEIGPIFRAAIVYGASGIIVCYGNPDNFSHPEDRELCIRMRECGKSINVNLRDSIILEGDHYFSFNDAIVGGVDGVAPLTAPSIRKPTGKGGRRRKRQRRKVRSAITQAA